jgi:hypothetical protein
MGEPHNSRQRAFIAAVLILPLAYVLCYAPMVRIMGGWTTEQVPGFDGRMHATQAPICGTTTLLLYRPVDWLIDEPRLSDPLFAWADLWGVEKQFREAVFWR